MKQLFVFLFLALAAPLFAQITIEGTVTDANGKVPVLAHAHIGKYNDQRNFRSYECAKDGHYSIQVPEAGIYSLRLSAVDHEEFSIPIILDEKDKSVTVNVKLIANPLVKDPDKITVIGDWNKFAFASSEQMTAQKTADGKTTYTYERTATGDTLSYQLMGTTPGGHSVNGTRADYFTYDGGGDYRSVIRTHKGDKVTITFDPAKVNYTEAYTPTVDIQHSPFNRNVYELMMSIKDKKKNLAQSAGGEEPVMTSEKYKSLLGSIKTLHLDPAQSSGDTKLAQISAVMLAKEFDPSLDFGGANADLIMSTVPANSPYWIMAPNEISAITQIGNKRISTEYQKELLNNPAKIVRAVVYADQMVSAVSAKNDAEWKRLYNLLKKDYADVPEIRFTVMNNNPDAAVQVGKPVPSFEVALLDGGGNVSNVSLLGKYYMIDFWATWCRPCVGEMPAIHKAYEKFKGKKGFDILSLSMDAKESDIAPFRVKKWKMPWMHAFIPGIWNAELAKKFEATSIPRPILVGPDGKVLAMVDELRGESLEKTLGKYLGEPN
jgi:thiol-disulfide isomerase/thioredoxin